MTAGLGFRSRHDSAGLRAFEWVVAGEISSSPFVRDTGGSLRHWQLGVRMFRSKLLQPFGV